MPDSDLSAEFWDGALFWSEKWVWLCIGNKK
jgi:hypothetical protein